MPSEKTRKALIVTLGVVAIMLGAELVYRSVEGAAPGTTSSLTKDVTIRDAETGAEWTMSRGRLEQALYQRSGEINPEEGLSNPETGTPTGFPVNRSREWDEVIERISAEKRAMLEKQGK